MVVEESEVRKGSFAGSWEYERVEQSVYEGRVSGVERMELSAARLGSRSLK